MRKIMFVLIICWFSPTLAIAADTTLKSLPEATTVTDDDLLLITDNPSGTPISKKVIFSNLKLSLGIFGATQGGTGQDSSAWSGVPIVTAGTWSTVDTPAGAGLFGYSGGYGFFTQIRLLDDYAQFGSATASKGLLKLLLSGSTNGKTLTLSSLHTDDKTVYLPDPTTGDSIVLGSAAVRFNTGANTARVVTLPDAAITSPFEDRLTATFDGGGTTAIAENTKAVLTVPFPCVVTGGQILASKKLGTSGTVSVTVDIWREATATDYDGGSSHPAVGDKICASACPVVTNANRAAIDPATWGAGATLAKGDILIFNANTITNAVLTSVTLYVSKR